MLDYTRSFAVFFPFTVLFLGIPLLIGILVWRDAGRRGMHHAWGLVAALVPYFLGLIAYLIVASQHKPLRDCPGCGDKVEQEFQVCPHCGYQLQDSCPQCHRTVAPDWSLCPHCGQSLKSAE